MENQTKLKIPMLLYVLVIVAIAAVAVSIFFGITANQKTNEISKMVEQVLQGNSQDDVAQENDVTIAGSYVIRATTQISDAYKSGDTSALSDRDKETLDMAKAVVDEVITENMTPYEKEKAIYEWMTTKLQSDSGLLTVIPTSGADCDNPYGVLKYHNAVCVGYATTFRLFMEMMDIPCMVVHNSERYHSWDLVQLDGEWYHTDIYSGAHERGLGYLNLSDDMQIAFGQNWNRSFFPAATGLKYSPVYMNAVALDDIYSVAGIINDNLDANRTTLSYKVPATFTESEAGIVNAICESASTCCQMNGQDVYISVVFLPIGEEGYILRIVINNYSIPEEGHSTQQLTEEDYAKVQEAVDKAFADRFGFNDMNMGGFDDMGMMDGFGDYGVAEDMPITEGAVVTEVF